MRNNCIIEWLPQNSSHPQTHWRVVWVWRHSYFQAKEWILRDWGRWGSGSLRPQWKTRKVRKESKFASSDSQNYNGAHLWHFSLQVLLQRGVLRLSAAGDHRHVGAGRPQEEAERPADTAEPRDPERRAHHQLSVSLTDQDLHSHSFLLIRRLISDQCSGCMTHVLLLFVESVGSSLNTGLRSVFICYQRLITGSWAVDNLSQY